MRRPPQLVQRPVRAPQRPPRRAQWAHGRGIAMTLRPARARQRGRLSRWRARLEARAAGRQQKKSNQLNFSQLKSSQCARSHLYEECVWLLRGGLAAAAPAADCAVCAAHAPPTLLAATRPAPATAATSGGPLAPPGALAADRHGALRRRCGSAAETLRPAPTRQTGRGESWATKVRGPGGAVAAAAASGRTTATHVATCTHTHLLSRARLTLLQRPCRREERPGRVSRAAGTTPET